MGHLLTNWMGDDGFLKSMHVELRRFNVVGDTTWCKGKITGKRVEDGERLVDMDIWGEKTQRQTGHHPRQRHRASPIAGG